MRTFLTPRLFVRLTANELVIAPFSGPHADMKQAQTITLINNEIVGNRIVNLTALARHVAAAATRFGLKQPRLIIEAPFIDETDSCALLSLTLCMARQFTIERISTTPNGKNLLSSFLTPAYHHIYRWGAFLALCCGIVGYIAITATSTCNRALKSQKSHIATLTAMGSSLQHKATEAHKIEQENITLEKKLTHRAHYATTTSHPEKVLMDIARTLPEASKLVQLSIDHQPPALTIKGITHHPADITTFIKKLTQQHTDYTFSLVNLKKQKRTQPSQGQEQQIFYAFAIQGLCTKPK